MGIPEKAKFYLQLLGCGLLEGSLQTGHWGLNIATFHVGRPLVTYKYATSKTLGCNGFLRVIEGSLERRGRVWEGRINIGYTFLVAGCSPSKKVNIFLKKLELLFQVLGMQTIQDR